MIAREHFIFIYIITEYYLALHMQNNLFPFEPIVYIKIARNVTRQPQLSLQSLNLHLVIKTPF